MACYVKGPADQVKISVLHEGDKVVLPWSVFQVHFGKVHESASVCPWEQSELGKSSKEKQKERANEARGSDEPPEAEPRERSDLFVKRAGSSSWKFCICHSRNKARFEPVAQEAKEMYTYCFNNQVDVLVGDGNQHMQFHSHLHKKAIQKHNPDRSDIHNGVFNLLLRGFMKEVNQGLQYFRRVNVRSFDNNRHSEQVSQEHVDCLFCNIFEWGKSDFWRETLQADIHNMASYYDAQYTSVDEVVWSKQRSMTDQDLDFLTEHRESAHPLLAPFDFDVRISERAKTLERHHFFLGSKDCDWLLPMLVTLREEATNNFRQRSAEGWKHRLEKKPSGKKSDKKGKGKGKSKANEPRERSGEGRGSNDPPEATNA